MADNPFATALQPGGNRTGMYEMRMMQMADRMDTGGSRRGYGRAGNNPMFSSMMGMANEPDYSQFTYDPAMRQRAMDAGVQPLEASQVRQNAMLPNNGFFGSHPRLSGAIEGGLFSMAAAHGGNTPGESIQGAIEGLIGGQQMRRGILNQQFARPFEAAGMIEGLEDRKQRRELQAADIEHLRAVNEHLKNGDDEKALALTNTQRHQEAMEATANARTEATAPRNLGGGLYGYYSPGGTGPSQKGDWSIQENPEAKLGRSAAGAGPWYSVTKNGQTTYGRVHEGAQVPEGAQLIQGDYQSKKADKEANASSSARDKWIKENSAISAKSASIWMAAGIQPGDKGTAKKLADFYDANIAPNLTGTAPSSGTPTYNPNTGKLE